MNYKTIVVEEKDMIGRITLNSPPFNILNIHMMKEINAGGIVQLKFLEVRL